MKQRYGNTTMAGRSAPACRRRIGCRCLACRPRRGMGAAAGCAAPAAAPAPTAAAVINAKAVERLNAMGAHLRSLKAFTVNADVTVEEVLDSGQKVENAITVEIAARMPDKLRVYTTSAERSRKIYYDGKTVTIFAEKLGYYGSFAAPATIARNDRSGGQEVRSRSSACRPVPDGHRSTSTRSRSPRPSTWDRSSSAACCATSWPSASPGSTGRSASSGARRRCRASWSSPGPAATRPSRYAARFSPGRPGSAPEAAAFTFVPPKGATRIAVKEAAK